MIQRKAAPETVTTPRHVAIIMDGNRRWAADRGLPASEGHRAGAAALRESIQSAQRAGVEILTVFAFSEENWKRDESEVSALMELVRAFSMREASALHEKNVRVRAIGRIEALPPLTRIAIDTLVRATAGNDGLLLNIALNYGARTEICDAIRSLALDIRNGYLESDAIDDDVLSKYLYTAGLPDPDLLIRTGGELRLSNFLLFQIAYAELWSTPVRWPDFDAAIFATALAEFSSRQRRFGS